MAKQIIKGEAIREYLDDKIKEDLITAFEDCNMNLEEDLEHCDLHITDKGTCWIHDTRNKTPFWNGTLIASFKIDGTGFYFSKVHSRNTERLNEYARKRIEFFKVPRTAREVDEFEKENNL